MTLAEEWFNEGIEKGMERGMRQIAINMIQKGLDAAQITKLSGVAIDEVKKMMQELKEKN